MSGSSSDVATMPCWHRCTDCEVTWNGTTTECWSCESSEHTVADKPPPTSDIYSARPAAPTDVGTRLTRHGSRLAG